ncbi:Os06g0671450 [Oryza sativa Japonica Group]|uniref:Os06g0671450 protein n=1 Tax=Oryza sativa subsp. japonica TaxID=39947 RepID=A0A0N7KMK6_ORYSJ|nr:Os06g0671450 [Oryza sativa Japonica Group]
MRWLRGANPRAVTPPTHSAPCSPRASSLYASSPHYGPATVYRRTNNLTSSFRATPDLLHPCNGPTTTHHRTARPEPRHYRTARPAPRHHRAAAHR